MDADPEGPFKLGRHEPGLGVVEHRFDDVFEVRAGALWVASAAGQIDLAIRVSRLFAAPLIVSYILLVPFAGYAEGRYQLTERFDHVSLELFLDRFREFFERDARHHLHVGDASGNSRLIYDQHNFISVIGPTDEVRVMLEREGFRSGEVALPVPHSHHHHSPLDKVGVKLLTEYEWTYGPLEESD